MASPPAPSALSLARLRWRVGSAPPARCSRRRASSYRGGSGALNTSAHQRMGTTEPPPTRGSGGFAAWPRQSGWPLDRVRAEFVSIRADRADRTGIHRKVPGHGIESTRIQASTSIHFEGPFGIRKGRRRGQIATRVIRFQRGASERQEIAMRSRRSSASCSRRRGCGNLSPKRSRNTPLRAASAIHSCGPMATSCSKCWGPMSRPSRSIESCAGTFPIE